MMLFRLNTKAMKIIEKVCIGIDTGTHTGVAVWDSTNRQFLKIETMQIHKAMECVRDYMDSLDAGMKLFVRVEDPRQRTWFGTERMSREEERKRLQGVGSVKRDAGIWEAFLTDLFASTNRSATFEMVAPKRNVTKLTSERFKAITGWKERTNEHGRDSAMLVFGI